MRRNLQTAAPLLRELDSLGTPVTAVVRRDNFEVLGMLHPADRPIMAQLEALQAWGKRDELVSLVKSTEWTPAGQSSNEMLAEFPHVELEEGTFPADADEGWYAQGFEGNKAIRRRFVAMVRCMPCLDYAPHTSQSASASP
jgi:hypothetical protein